MGEDAPHYEITSSEQQLRSGEAANTHFIDAHTLETVIRPDVSSDTFEAVISEEMSHAIQKLSGYPSLRALPFGDENAAQKLSTLIMDVDAHAEMRRRGISTLSLGMEDLQAAENGNFRLNVPPNAPVVDTAARRLNNSGIYIRYWDAFHEDPAMPKSAWEKAERFFRQSPQMEAMGQRCVTVIQSNGFASQEGRRNIYRQILTVLNLGEAFALIEGPPNAPPIEIVQSPRL